MEGAQWMEGGVNQTGTEPNRKKNRSEPRAPKPNQNPSEKPKRTETKRGFTVLVVDLSIRSFLCSQIILGLLGLCAILYLTCIYLSICVSICPPVITSLCIYKHTRLETDRRRDGPLVTNAETPCFRLLLLEALLLLLGFALLRLERGRS